MIDPRQPVQHEAFTGVDRDPRGNTVETWAAPVEVLVVGWYTGTSYEPQIGGHERVRVDAHVICTADFRPTTKDRITLPGAGRFEVNGEVEDYNHGPWWAPGLLVVNLLRVAG